MSLYSHLSTFRDKSGNFRQISNLTDGWGRGEVFGRNFRYCMTVYSGIFLFFGIIISVESILRLNYGGQLLFFNVLSPTGNKNTCYFADNNGTYRQGLCGSLWITKNF